VNESASHILDIVLPATSPQVPLRVVVSLQVSVNSLSDGEAANIEFAVFVKQRLFAVFLNNVTALFTVNVRVRNNAPNLR